jgi:hypothetical protein
MGGINVGRWIAGGVVAAGVFFVLEGLGGLLYGQQMEVAMSERGLTILPGAGTFMLAAVMSLIAGLVLIWFYAVARTRFGPGPATAVKVAVVLWFGMWLLHLLGYRMLGLFPGSLLAMWGVVTFVETLLAALAGAWLYKEAPAR